MKSIGERIKSIRLQLGLTLEEFGLLFDPPADKSNVSRWEKNKATPSSKRLKKIAELGNIPIEELLSTEQYKTCPQCKFEKLKEEYKYCPICGKKVEVNND